MDLSGIFAIGVLINRLAAIGAASFCLWLGFRLFASAQRPSGAELSYRDLFKINLYQVGPGVFFCMAGAAVLLSGVYNPPTLSESQTRAAQPRVPAADAGAAEPAPTQVVLTGVAPSAQLDRAEQVRAQQQITFLNRALSEDSALHDASREDVSILAREIKLSLMQRVWDAAWGEFAAFREWAREPSTSSAPNARAAKIFSDLGPR
jgi:hypothetical protein